ncbi:transcriptional regulator, TetR family [Clostridium cavendishii DSM 21758]|uniref:Transcriptional regulator, TetR family n=1 Tax=Clostridium cavendishii DSM 21758 TaxID=1121302 RepID=A0A1M6IS46_9CLOT|nr:TetR/AcrR family transcriptional regulator [Clostridium cavendishii]SHJ37281.1 transcriptional regulator, TetR family [Clostridium cavendishii DSM 21758]
MLESQRQKQKLKTKNNIIEVALKQFAKDGLTTTRTADIASIAKVSHGTIFAHFETREILLGEVIEEFGRRITSRLHELVSSNCEMKEVLQAHLQGISEYEEFYTRLILESRLLNEDARNSIIMIQSAVSFHIIQVAEREMKEGKIREMPVDLLFNTWIGLVHHYLINSDLFTKENSVLKTYGDKLINHYLNLIAN